MIEIVAYRPTWPSEYRDLAARIRAAVGDAVVGLHHIGSTSVPALAAKDVIDIQLTIADLERVPHAQLEAAGFVRGKPSSDHCPPGIELPAEQLSKWFYSLQTRRANLHVRQAGRFNQRYPLLCRDYLRAHPSAAAAYAQIKRQLARHFPHDAEAYYDVKDPVFDLLMAAAEDWARATGWSLPPSD